MPEAWLLAAATVACLIGMGWLALAMKVHWKQVRGDAPGRAALWRLRVLGALGLIVALALCLSVDQASMAVLVWVMALAVSALGIALTLSWRPRWLRALTWVCGDDRGPR